ncbi:MAG TPA: glycosyl hydrolase [Candidatus Paceibacterota bacterium]|nr:glycosyl hydrolase [Verrucomicrobiota bacterium]HRY46412.1 glycosyl hydrolase [Candidatus Paceibacterota bacterium]
MITKLPVQYGRPQSFCMLVVLLTLMLAAGASHLGRAQSLEAGFVNPPDDTKPWCYWYWISDNLSKEGITRDLEAMARVGIGEAFIGNIFLEDVPAGKTKVLTPEWWSLVEHAIREGGRTGVNIGMFNCPGWSQSGGPWIQSTETMRYLAMSEMRVSGPRKFAGQLPAPKEPFQDVALLAFPVPQHDANSLAIHSPRVTSSPASSDLAKLIDNDPASTLRFPEGAGRGQNPFSIEFAVTEPFTARSLQITPADEAFGAQCELQAMMGQGAYQTIRRFKCDRSNMATGVGFMPRGPVTISFPAVTANKFRLIFTGFYGGRQPTLSEITLSSAARLEAFVEKQLGKMHPTPLPMWETYLWPTQPEPDSRSLVVSPGDVHDLTKQLAPDGTLAWDVPAGDWILQRIGMTPTGMKNSPASPEGQGLEVDKMNRALAQRHFDAFIGEVLRRIPAADRKAFKRVVADSYEMGSQNWTDGFDAQFRQRYGYDPKPWLPVLSGRLVGSANQSERFLWDLRRLVADRVATDYVGGLREACKPHGLGLWLENYGHWGFPGEFLKYGGESDRIGGEYWVTGELGSIELRAASSCANTYGRKYVSAESFTGGPAFQNAPGALKARGDWSFCEGVNHFVLHVYIQQPWEDRLPGVNAWFGTEFNRHNTWFDRSKAWIDYTRRCCWLLQQGNRAADVAYFIGEDAPKMTGVRKPDLPPGRDFDYINADVIETKLTAKNGLLTLPHGTSYRLLVLPELETMRPEVLRKVRDLVRAGATVFGPPPSRSPSMENYPNCDDEVRILAADLWGAANRRQPGERSYGKGRIIWGKSLDDVLASLNSPTDFQSSTPMRFTHRREKDLDIYFVANPKHESLATTIGFRVSNKAPELWWPDSGTIESPAVYETANGQVRLPISFGPHGSVFVVFRQKAAPNSQRIHTVTQNGNGILDTKLKTSAAAEGGDNPNDFTFATWIKPADSTTLVREASRGVVGMSEKRNDVLAAPHGDGFGGSGHAGCGLAVGTNGVCVFEHGANYFAPTLVHAVPLTDWTHLAVVYRNGQPSLYLNGAPVRTGLKSEHVVHSGAGAGALAQFRGQVGSFMQFSRPLNDPEISNLAKTMPRPDQTLTGPAIQFTRQGREIKARVTQPGNYEVTFANGRQQTLTVRDVPIPQNLIGPWEVRFTPGWGAPERVIFDFLCDWSQHPENGIRHYSGKATYRTTFNLTAHASRFILNLGDLHDLATVRMNGKELGTLWMAPWQLEVTDALKPGLNTLEVEVINVWNNRLVADAALPASQRRTFLLAPTVAKDAPLLPAGLMGPVVLQPAIEIQLK